MFEPLPESADEHIERLLRSVLAASPGVPAADVLADIDPNQLGQRGQLHHRLKTHTGWQLKRNPDDSVEWTSPAGLTYWLRPPTVPPDG